MTNGVRTIAIPIPATASAMACVDDEANARLRGISILAKACAMGEPASGSLANRWPTLFALSGFIMIATAQVSNMILARGLAGQVPAFSLAFFRWSIIAAALAPFAYREAGSGRLQFRKNIWLIAVTGFFGMFLCGGPIYIAGITTTAINIALIMALSPIVVLLLSQLFGLEKTGAFQLLGMALALLGALFMICRGDPTVLIGMTLAPGDLLVLLAMLGWSGYTLLQTRVAPAATSLARVSVFAAAGALLSLPIAAWETWEAPQKVFNVQAAAAYVFAGLVPGVFAYVGFTYLSGKFGSVRTSLMLYVGPIASALLSFAILREPPTLVHIFGGAAILGGVWISLRK